MADTQVTHWPGLESSPDVFNSFASKLGLPSTWAFCDVFGLDDDCLGFVSQPCVALILLFPCSAKASFAPTQSAIAATDPQAPRVFYLEQVKALDDACGTIAMIHGLSNNLQRLGITGGPLFDFVNASSSLSAHDLGTALSQNAAIAALHTATSQQGQTQAVAVGETNHHFVCFTQVGDYLVELDGTKKGPIFHQRIDPSVGLLKSAADVVTNIYFSSPDVHDFSLIALAAKQAD